jgi:hypothetical protein
MKDGNLDSTLSSLQPLPKITTTLTTMSSDAAAPAAPDAKKVKLQSSDNESFDVDQDVVSRGATQAAAGWDGGQAEETR